MDTMADKMQHTMPPKSSKVTGPKKRHMIHADPNVVEGLKKIANIEEVSLTALVNRILQAHLDRYSTGIGLTVKEFQARSVADLIAGNRPTDQKRATRGR